MIRFGIPAPIAAALIAAPLCATAATCPGNGGVPPTREDWAALYAEMSEQGTLQKAGFTVGAQDVYYLGTPDTSGPLLARVEALAPRIVEQEIAIAVKPTRPVLFVESHTDTFGASMAFTGCNGLDGSSALRAAIGSRLPPRTCMIVTFPERMAARNLTDFSIAHEWMHTMQYDAYGASPGNDACWREASADWFAHKVVPGTTARNDVIEQFFGRQPACELTEHSYDAQTFYFWAEAEFDTEWVFEQGLDGEDWLRDTSRAATLLPPDRWLDWAIAQADGTIRFPDGRPLPSGPDSPAVNLTETCDATIEGEALSVQVADITLPETGGALTVEAGTAQVGLRGPDGDWIRVTGTQTISPPPASPVRLAAISPSGEPLSVGLSSGNSSGSGCRCFVGRWMELPGPDGSDPFRFRSKLESVFAKVPDMSVTYEYDGPVVSINGDGSLTIDNPHTMTGPDVRVENHRWQAFGTWTAEDGAIAFDIEARRTTTHASMAGVSRTFTEEHKPTIAIGGKWIPECSADGLALRRWMFIASERSDEVHRLVPAP
ncbi:hypothetical protein [Pseudoruegeria sp. HB172150]|uniref:hypothetical protein n=1 Tax=Pseudoruegeria sp. HB172150 TaxID=2721164 RepID=UPI00155336F2|nr:hypothetical protein [Pseudoruegeria sp. HB172150]